MEPKEIRQKINEYWDERYYFGAKTAYALAMTLPDDELVDMVADYFYNKGVRTVIGKNRDGSPRYSMLVGIIRQRGLEHRLWQRQRKPILAAMEELSSDNCKNKTVLRNHLKNWYCIANEKYKQRILLFMLNQPTKKERQWAYSRIMTQWDNAYYEAVAQAFEKYDDDHAAKVIMNHFPAEYIYRHRERLSELKGYGWVCSIIGKDYPEAVSLDLLSSSQRMRVIRSLDLKEHANELEDMLYRSIASEVAYILSWGELDTTDICFDRDRERLFAIKDLYSDYFCYYYPDDWSPKDGFYLAKYFGMEDEDHRYYTLNLFDFNGVTQAVRAMGSLGMADALVRFEDLNRRCLLASDDRDNLPRTILKWLQYIYQRINVEMLGYAPLPEKYNTLLSWEAFKAISNSTFGEMPKYLTDDDECLDLPY
ncbi:MAG: hypothetical protein J5741_07395 [Bacteroidales bacterium]|nr:hypothetical protein [Bacteroidales bacterium]